MGKRLDFEEVKRRIEEKGAKVLSESFGGWNVPLLIRCKCGNVFSRSWNNLKQDEFITCSDCSRVRSAKKQSFDFEFVKKTIEDRGATLLSEVYVNNTTPLLIRCSCGETFTMTFQMIRDKKRGKKTGETLTCKQCSWRGLSDFLKYDIEYIREEVVKRGATLLSDSYDGKSGDLELLCKCGRMFKRSWNSIRDQDVCVCLKCQNREKYSFELVKEEVEKRGARLLSTEYKNAHTPILIQCKCGNKFERSFSTILHYDFLECLSCSGIRKVVYSLDDMKREVERRGAELIGLERVNGMVRIKCRCGEIFERPFFNILKSNLTLCVSCRRRMVPRGREGQEINAFLSSEERVSKEMRYRFFVDHVIPLVLGLYSGKGLFKGYKGKVSVHHMYARSRYPEKEMLLENLIPLPVGYHVGKGSFHSWFAEKKRPDDWVGGFVGNETKEDLIEFINEVPVFNGLERDVDFLRLVLGLDKRFSIEFLFDLRKSIDPSFLIGKKRELAEKGVLYIPIFREDLIKKDILISRLSSIIGINDKIKKLNARDFEVKKILYKDAKEFLERSHLQGSVPASFCYALLSDGKLMSVMTFGRSRFDSGENGVDSYELLRFASRLNFQVRGAASRLFKAFIREVNPDRVVSYADVRFSSLIPMDTVYSKLGFEHMRVSSPGYWYVDENGFHVFSRIQFQKHRLRGLYDRGEIKYYNESWTERRVAEENGLIPQYDCGNHVFVWRKDKKMGG